MRPAWRDDSTWRLLRDGYEFASRRGNREGTDVIETRLLLVPVTFLRGRDAAEVFYDPSRFARTGAMPGRIRKTLLGVGGVQGLDGAAHHRRKELFLSLMTAERIESLVDAFDARWREQAETWVAATQVVLYDEVGPALCAAAHAWTGIPLQQTQVAGRTADLRAMIDAPAAVGPRHRRGRAARRRAEIGLSALVERVRGADVENDSPLSAIATHRDENGRLLSAHSAAVELLNLIRPIVAIDRFVTFAAVALHEHPAWRDRLRAADGRDTELFVQEVRRFYPFFPLAAARVIRPFDWAGHHFPRRRRVLLDLYGTDRHPEMWHRPDVFDPERFRDRPADPFALIPQGGGDHHVTHRCAGEWITIAVMKRAVDRLARMSYRVPPQDLRISLRRMPTLPASGFVITDVESAI